MIEELGESGLKVIMILGLRGEMVMLDIKKSGVSYSSLYRVIPILINYGLVEEVRRGQKRYFKLTGKGKMFYEKLMELEELLKKP